MTKNKVFLNVKYGMLSQIIKILLQFISRKIFIYYLGVELLGVNSLFASILSILSMTELGVGSAVAFSLYGPIAEKDNRKIAGIMCLYRTVYKVIGFVVLAIGCIMLPFIPSMVNTSENIPFIRVMFFIVLLKTALTYLLFAYSQTLLIAAESKYIVDQITTLFYVLTNIGEIIVLVLTKNFIAYLLIEMLCLIVQQYVVYRKAKIKYPEIMTARNVRLGKNEKKEIWKNVYGLSINKFAGAILSSIDNVIMSAFISTAIVGVYSNYTMVLTAATSVMSIAFTSVTANVGRKFAEHSANEKQFYLMFYVNFFICGFCSVMYFVLINDFIKIAFGNNLILEKSAVVAITVNMVITYMSLAVQVFKEASGIFWYGKYRPVATCILNIVFSIALVKVCGITGVIAATTISRLLTTTWYDPYLVFKHAFKKKPGKYFLIYLFDCCLIITAILGINYVTSLPIWGKGSIVSFSFKAIVAAGLSVLYFTISTIWMKEPKTLLKVVYRGGNKRG